MSMGNYKWTQRLIVDTMSTCTPPIGLDHPTTVPENLESYPSESVRPDCEQGVDG